LRRHGGTSAGIEPIPANIYTHKTLSGSFTVKNRLLEELLESKGLNTDEVWGTILENEGSVLSTKKRPSAQLLKLISVG